MVSAPTSRAKAAQSSMARSGSASRTSRGVSSCRAAVSTPTFMNRGRKGVTGTAYHNGGGTVMATRREFTAGVAAAAAGMAIALRAEAKQRMKPSVFGGIQVGVQSYTFRAFDIDRMIAAMTSIGISSVEL